LVVTLAPTIGEQGSRQRLSDFASSAVSGRVQGIDLARAIAILGMVMVHIGPIRLDGFGLAGAAYRLPVGRASILFVVVAGIGISLLAGDRSRERLRGTSARLLWRALVLLPLGLALQALDTPVAVIIQYYAVYFAIAVVGVRLRSRTLAWAAGASALLGPVLLLGVRRLDPGWFDAGTPAWNDFDRIARDLVVSGYYPAVVWMAPLLVGMWLGRQNVRSTRTAIALLLGGAAMAAVVWLVGNALGGIAGDVENRASWLQLLTREAHEEMPLWILSSTSIAIGIVGASLLLARAATRLTWPLVAAGQLALTIYAGHLLLLHYRPEWLIRSEFATAWASVGRFALLAVLAALVWRSLAARGPLEAVLHLPWLRRGRTGPVPADTSRPVDDAEAAPALRR
jgi:hypothetical protein